MGRYLLKFTKEKNLKYISHLDLLRLFQRAFKRGGISLSYSKGYNPHPKMGFAQPLSLGTESFGEYLEFETDEQRTGEYYRDIMSGCMPDGISILSCLDMKQSGKTSAAAAVAYASYIVKGDISEEAKALLLDGIPKYINQDEIICRKINKKKKLVENNIKPLIRSFNTGKTDHTEISDNTCHTKNSDNSIRLDNSEKPSESEIVFSMTLRTGSNGNLNPEVLIKSLCEFCNVEYLRHEWNYLRQEMYFQVDGSENLLPLSEFKG